MEANLEAEFNEIMKNDDVTGAMLSNEHGLCLLAMLDTRNNHVTGIGKKHRRLEIINRPLQASPNIKPEMAGILSAIVQHASKIDNRNENPVINFEGESRQCLIKKEGAVTTAVFKKIS